MIVTITCLNQQYTDYVRDCVDNTVGSKQRKPTPEQLTDILQYDLTTEEIEIVKNIDGVVSVISDDTRVSLDYTILDQIGAPRLASYATSFGGNSVENCVPHSLHYCQTYDPTFIHDFPTNGVSNVSLSSIDCSNVDVLVLDTGIDPNHPEFKDDLGNSNVVLFNWTQLRTDSGNQIVSFQSPSYYGDTDGHGTACASLIAGKRCGFAKNAKIYSLRGKGLSTDSSLYGFSVFDCLSLAIAFQKAKQLNLYGLDSTRPTVFSNSWGFTGPSITDDLDPSDANNLNFYISADLGKNSINYNRLPGVNSVSDGYVRECLNQGIHMLFSAGNINNLVTNNPVSSIDVHSFTKSGSEYVIAKTPTNRNSFSSGGSYNGYTYNNSNTRYLYTSPNIGLNFNKDDYPVIIVGDVIPIGQNDNISDLYWSSANATAAFKVLSGLTTESRINTTDTRQETVSSAAFIKSAYSSFGPDVDIYAPGNGAWAAHTNMASTVTAPSFTSGSPTNKFRWFNGTSSSCPIVAGILATFLAEHPNASPSVARQWLIDNGIKGNIMQTQPSTIPVLTVDGLNPKTLQLPYGPDITTSRVNPMTRLQKAGGMYASAFNTADIEDVLYCNRFFNSNNIIAQAYPLRKSIQNSSNPNTTIADTQMTIGSTTTKRKTH
jgi:subtilisin family serine protease